MLVLPASAAISNVLQHFGKISLIETDFLNHVGHHGWPTKKILRSAEVEKCEVHCYTVTNHMV